MSSDEILGRRPILRQSDLQSVEKVAFQHTFARAFDPKMREIGRSRLRMGWTFPKDLSGAAPRFYRRPVARNQPSNVITVGDCNPAGSKKY